MAWMMTGEFLELVNKMGLIVVAAIIGNFGK